MKAIVKNDRGPGNVGLREVPEPVPGRYEVKIRVEAAGICGSDLHILHGDIGIPMRPPFVIGHEFSGVIVEVGSDVTQWQPGQRVTAENTRKVCGRCRYCMTGYYNLCRERLATGYAFDGAFASYCVVPAERVHLLPDNVDFVSGALSDPSACAYRAVQEVTGIEAGDVVLITGPGPMGLFCLQYVKANGGQVILTGLTCDKERFRLARELGADVAVDVERENLREVVMDLTNGEGADVALECSGAEKAAQQALEMLRRQGKYTQVGIFGSPVSVDMDQIVFKELRMTGSFSHKFTAWEKAISCFAQGKVVAKPLVTDVLRLEEWEQGFRRFEEKKAIKVVFTPQAVPGNGARP